MPTSWPNSWSRNDAERIRLTLVHGENATMMEPRVVNAGNQGPFTLDGTRTYLVGTRHVAVIDPGPDVDSHLEALLQALASAERVTVVVTHWHDDHAALVPRLSAALGGPPVHGPGEGSHIPLVEGQLLDTDLGSLRAVSTPGHARLHFVFHHEGSSSLFAGDLLLGQGDTTWVGEYPGCVADYLASLERVRAIGPDTIHPAHGPTIRNVPETLDRYQAHRQARIDQVAAALQDVGEPSVDRLMQRIYGEVPNGVAAAARSSLEAILHHLGR